MLPAITTTKPEGAVAEHYEEDGGKYYLKVEPVDGFALENISGLKSALSKELERRKEAEGKLKKFGGIDPDDAREAISKLEELSAVDPKAEADKIAAAKIDAAVKKMAAQHKEEVERLKGSIQSQREQLDKLVRTDAITKAIIAADGNVDLLGPLINQHTRINDDGRLELVDTDGLPMLANSGKPLELEEYVTQLKNDRRFGGAFKSSGAAGSGAHPKTAGGESGAVTMSRADFEALTPAARMKFSVGGGKLTE